MSDTELDSLLSEKRERDVQLSALMRQLLGCFVDGQNFVDQRKVADYHEIINDARKIART